jgi:hypothetical protein
MTDGLYNLEGQVSIRLTTLFNSRNRNFMFKLHSDLLMSQQSTTGAVAMFMTSPSLLLRAVATRNVKSIPVYNSNKMHKSRSLFI